MHKRWLIKEKPSQEAIASLADALTINEALASILIQRGISTFDEAKDFFRPQLSQLHDPFLMKDLDKAVERIQKAIKKGEKILLFGDYDVDGTTAVAVMYNVLYEHYKHLDFYIPDRYSEGYGISIEGINFAKKNNFHLIIALDCGVKSNDKITYAKENGIDFIVCDHHLPGDELPDCIVLDPKRNDCDYPYKELSGCGVGFKLLQGLCIRQDWEQTTLFQQLDLLALSIGADIVPITGENRILCYYGLQQLNASPRKGIVELVQIAKKSFPLTLTNVVFIIAPRINAAGRIHSGKKSVELMISDELVALKQLAKAIHDDNDFRRTLDEEITREAFIQIEENPLSKEKWTTVVYDEHWHKGVVGIVASRLIEKHYKPTIVLTNSNGKITGSARSIKGLNIHDALENCADLLEQFGGHAFAAGMTMPIENLTAFSEKFEQEVRKLMKKEDLIPMQVVDYELLFSDIFAPDEMLNELPVFKRIMLQCEPHGPENMKPVFISKNIYVRNFSVLKDLHLKMILTQANLPITIDAIAFNMIDKLPYVEDPTIPVDILYTLETNTWRDSVTVQLNIKDIRPTI